MGLAQAYYCETRSDVFKTLQALHDMGYKWASGDSLLEYYDHGLGVANHIDEGNLVTFFPHQSIKEVTIGIYGDADDIFEVFPGAKSCDLLSSDKYEVSVTSAQLCDFLL